MLTLRLHRRYKGTTYTIGTLYVENSVFCDTLEDKDRGLVSTMPLGQISSRKVYGQTAIPTGEYRIVLSKSQKFASKAWGKKYKGLVPELQGVRGFSGVRVHPGTTEADTLGCVLVGRNTAKGKVLKSQDTYYELMDRYLVPAHESGEAMRIIID